MMLAHQAGYNKPSPGVVEELKRIIAGGEFSLFGTQPKWPWLHVRNSFYLQVWSGTSYGKAKTLVLKVQLQPAERGGTFVWQLLYTFDEAKVWAPDDWTELVRS
mmetsp:Transcript_34256/g.101819  ORF Transcript_34256/g.101819 Transcript_34256/m.101819 type:complete len:104 (+) Transcript_34256:73-384(+)